MKKSVLPLLSAAGILVLLLTACQKEIDHGQNTGGAADNFKAKIEGTPWAANKGYRANRVLGIISITGFSNDKKYITMTLCDSGVHRYTLSDATLINTASYIDSNEANPQAYTTNQGTYPAQSGGEVQITAIDTANKKISGTFSFKVFRQADGQVKNITEGSFTNLTYSTTLLPSNATDTFRVKISGTQWIPPTILAVKTPAVPPLPASIAITGTDATSGKSVGLLFPPDITPGLYIFDFTGGTYVGIYNPNTNPQNAQVALLGTLQILSHNTTNKRITGNFNFRSAELLNPLAFTNLTEGYFAVTYQ